MKASNEFINLRLHSLEQALGIIDCLFDNGYTYKNYSQEDTIRDTVKKDITRALSGKQNRKKRFDIYYVEIDNEIREFDVYSKTADIIDIRKDKIKQIRRNI